MVAPLLLLCLPTLSSLPLSSSLSSSPLRKGLLLLPLKRNGLGLRSLVPLIVVLNRLLGSVLMLTFLLFKAKSTSSTVSPLWSALDPDSWLMDTVGGAVERRRDNFFSTNGLCCGSGLVRFETGLGAKTTVPVPVCQHCARLKSIPQVHVQHRGHHIFTTISLFIFLLAVFIVEFIFNWCITRVTSLQYQGS